jgi:hypothetical protein
MIAMWCRGCECTFPSDWEECPSCQDGEGRAPLAELPGGVADHIAELRDACQSLESERDAELAWLDEIAGTLGLVDHDPHGGGKVYGSPIACVESINSLRADLGDLRRRVAELEGAMIENLVTSYGVHPHVLGLEGDAVIDVVTCDCGARVEGQGRDPRKVRLEHHNGCLLSKSGPMMSFIKDSDQ